jgi:formate dehydrogenase subunit delta
VTDIHVEPSLQPAELRLFGDIAAQFRHMPVDTAAAQVAGHIRQFWDPRMRAKLAQHFATGPLDELSTAVARLLAP